nr:phosphomannomutase [Vibrio fluvialis]
MICSDILKNSGVAFGTSGARGLVSDFTEDVCSAFVHAFIQVMSKQFSFDRVAIAIDNRPSSPRIAQYCVKVLNEIGIDSTYFGVIPTPALAYMSMRDSIPSIMITGSHIPFDRNGIKFYRPDGEITKLDEESIINSDSEISEESTLLSLPDLVKSDSAGLEYIRRYTSLFGNDLLSGKRIGIYEHSSAGRDLYEELFSSFGATIISLGRSDDFVPIDTEAVSDDDKAKAIEWSHQYNLDAIFSTDGDGDRPLLADENGHWLRGDILGLLCSQALNVNALAVPVSCNSVIDHWHGFDSVIRTKIGSPYVIEELVKLAKSYRVVAGFEANGGYLLGSDVDINGNILNALPTRDAILPVLMVLVYSGENGISSLVNKLPSRVTYSDRIQNFPNENSQQILKFVVENPLIFLEKLGFSQVVIESIDMTDGVRLLMSNKDVIHLRPSGNAPELRCYSESDSLSQAKYIVDHVLGNVRKIIKFSEK